MWELCVQAWLLGQELFSVSHGCLASFKLWNSYRLTIIFVAPGNKKHTIFLGSQHQDSHLHPPSATCLSLGRSSRPITEKSNSITRSVQTQSNNNFIVGMKATLSDMVLGTVNFPAINWLQKLWCFLMQPVLLLEC